MTGFLGSGYKLLTWSGHNGWGFSPEGLTSGLREEIMEWSAAMKKFYERRSGHERRDWDVYVRPDRRSNPDRRCGVERRQPSQAHAGSERRREREVPTESPPPQPVPTSHAGNKTFYTTAEVAEMTGLSQTTLLLWIRNKLIDGSRIKRSLEGKRLWTHEDVEEVKRVKARNGWVT